MKRLNNDGALNSLAIIFFLTIVLLIGSLVFGFWAFMGRQDFKSQSDKKIAIAVAAAEKKTAAAKDAEYADKEKNQLKTYLGPVAYGSMSFKYPRAWSALITEAVSGTNVVDGYFYPNYLPGGPGNGTVSQAISYSLRVQIISSAYSDALRPFVPGVTSGKLKARPIKATLASNTVGTRYDGEIFLGKQGSMAVFPLRDKTILVWTESTNFSSEFENTLASLSFVP